MVVRVPLSRESRSVGANNNNWALRGSLVGLRCLNFQPGPIGVAMRRKESPVSMDGPAHPHCLLFFPVLLLCARKRILLVAEEAQSRGSRGPIRAPASAGMGGARRVEASR